MPEGCTPGFVSFASTGHGDDWCWYPAATADGRVPVVLCPHDDEAGEFYASDFIHALYRRLLDHCRGPFGWHDQDIQRKYLARWASNYGPLLPAACAAVLNGRVDAPVQRWTERGSPAEGLITPDQYEEIVRRDLAFPRLGEAFRWMDD